MLGLRCKWLAVAALTLLPHGAALAADTIRGDRLTTTTLPLDRESQNGSYIDSATDKDWWKVSLTKGKAYILRSNSYSCSTMLAVYNNAGRKLTSAPCSGYYTAALEFIPTYTGIHYVEFVASGKATSYPQYYQPDALNDCAGSKATTCTQPIDLDFSTRLNSRSDSDWRAISLRAGQTYTATATDYNTFFLSVRKPDGSILAYRSGYAPRIVFRAPTTGKYFVEVKSTRDTYWGSNLVYYMVATGNVPSLAPASGASALEDNAPRTREAAKAMGGVENID